MPVWHYWQMPEGNHERLLSAHQRVTLQQQQQVGTLVHDKLQPCIYCITALYFLRCSLVWTTLERPVITHATEATKDEGHQ